MHAAFLRHVEALHPKFEMLMAMRPVTLVALPPDARKSGIYLLSEGDQHLYVGRTRDIRARLRGTSDTTLAPHSP